MLRRSHKKSKDGCLECKRRHVKCDERRPVCVICTMSGRQADCKFATRAAPDRVPTTRSTPPQPAASPSLSNGSTGSLPGATASLNSAAPSYKPLGSTFCPSPEYPITHEPFQDPSVHEMVNIDHTELYVHLLRSAEMFNLTEYIGDYKTNALRGLEMGLVFPYVLHVLLGFTARHLASKHQLSEQSSIYRHRAMVLQTRAVSMFNGAKTAAAGVDASNCVPVIIFSSILAQHILADTLATRDDGSLDAFLLRWVHCARVCRGLFDLSLTSWPLLMQSELNGLLSVNRDFTSREPVGDDCSRVLAMLDTATGLTDEERDACREALRRLQVGLDAVVWDEQAQCRNMMVFSWIMLAPPTFTDMLAAKRPEALVLMAYYALLLHHRRRLWQVQDAGEYIMSMIQNHLGLEWNHWLELPRETILGRFGRG